MTDFLRSASVLFATLVLGVATPTLATPTADEQVFDAARIKMVDRVAHEARKSVGSHNHYVGAILEVMRVVPRHLFVPDNVRTLAYDDSPHPIGYDQTISDAYIVAVMTALLKVGPDDSVLEVGTGSGYQAAILAGLVKNVYSIEIVEPLAVRSAALLASLGNSNVNIRNGDGYLGWPEHAPFDAIIVTAGASSIPAPLLAQLKTGGRLIMPIGRNWATEHLELVERRRDGTFKVKRLEWVSFVPLTGIGQTDFDK